MPQGLRVNPEKAGGLFLGQAKYCPPEGCVVGKIIDFKRVLLDAKAGKPEKQQALKFLIHFIRDLHCPPHVGDTGSKGGNLIQVRFFDRGSNLHSVWDSGIIQWHSTGEEQWLKEINELATPEKATEWSKGTIEDWATEILEAAKIIYCLPGSKEVMPSGTKLGEEYCQMALPIVQRQLAKAAVWFAAVLNEVFK